jgi:nucleoside-diphosphate-sugar epimerase
LEGDIRSADTVQAACREVDVVLHQAAIPSVSRSVDDPVTTNEVNVTGTLNLLMAARAAGVRRFVAASSSSLYGESPTLPKVETMMPAPISPYGLQKLTAETYLALFHRLYGLGTVALRYFNVFGPRQDPSSEYAAVIPRFVTRIAAGQAPTIYGDGKQTRDFTYIDNVVQANLRAAEASPEACGQAYNIACGERISLLELVEKINRVLGERASAQHEPARTGDIRDSLADIDKARRLLRYQPEVTLDQGIERTVLSLVGTTRR